MDMVLSSRPRTTYALVPANGRDIMENVISSGTVVTAEPAVDEADPPFIAGTLPTERRTRPRITKKMQNATFVMGLVSSLSVFEPAPTLAADPLGLGWHTTPATYGTLQILDSVFEPVGGSQHLAVLNDRIDRFIGLPAGWDGDDGIAPSQAAGDHAKAFLISLMAVNLPHECHAVGDGEILLQWRSVNSFIEAAFDGATISWYAQLGAGAAEYSDDVFVNPESIDIRLKQAIALIG